MSPVAWSNSGVSGHPVYGLILILVKVIFHFLFSSILHLFFFLIYCGSTSSKTTCSYCTVGIFCSWFRVKTIWDALQQGSHSSSDVWPACSRVKQGCPSPGPGSWALSLCGACLPEAADCTREQLLSRDGHSLLCCSSKEWTQIKILMWIFDVDFHTVPAFPAGGIRNGFWWVQVMVWPLPCLLSDELWWT